EFITLRYPHLCGTVWVMFSEHLLTPATLKRYAADATLRAERMQPITPKQWIGAPQAKGDTVPLSSADTLKAVLEYRGVRRRGQRAGATAARSQAGGDQHVQRRLQGRCVARQQHALPLGAAHP
ncbi:hypothetical protein DXO129_20160, partial [Xanthomonas oryzae pv. oryzae]